MQRTIKTILVEDQQLAMEGLVHQLQENCPQIELLAQCNSGQEAVYQIQKHRPDLLFMDYNLGNMTGFQVLKRLQHLNHEVIFTTSYDEHAISAINGYNPVYYLVKPINEEELVVAVQKAIEIIQKKASTTEELYIIVSTRGEKDRIPLKDIKYLRGNDTKTEILVADGRYLSFSKTLKEVHYQLPQDRFIRIHKSYVVNKDQIQGQEIVDEKLYCKITHPSGGKIQKLPVGHTYKNNFDQIFK